MKVKITKCLVMRHTHGSEAIYLSTDLPNPHSSNTGKTLLAIPHVNWGSGHKYCNEHFPGVPVEVVII